MSYRKFPQVDYADADAELTGIYDDIMATVRVPWVAFTIRSLATFPGVVQVSWPRTREVFASYGFESAGRELRALAGIPDAPVGALRTQLRAGGWSESDLDHMAAVAEALAYGNPKYCVLITAWAEAVQGRAGQGSVAAADGESTPYGIRDDLEPLRLVDPNAADPQLRSLFARIRDDHHWHDVASDYRALARWPAFLSAAYDSAIGPLVRSPDYDAVARGLLVRSRELAAQLPGPAGLDADELTAAVRERGEDLSDRDIAAVTGLLTLFQRFVMDITIDMVRLRLALGEPASTAVPR